MRNRNHTRWSLFCSLDSDPRILTQRAFGFLLAGPLVDAVSMIGMVAWAPGNSASFILRYFIGLALETGLVDAVLTNGAVFDSNIPAPQCHSIPLLYLNPFVHFHSKYYYKFKLIDHILSLSPIIPEIPVYLWLIVDSEIRSYNYVQANHWSDVLLCFSFKCLKKVLMAASTDEIF